MNMWNIWMWIYIRFVLWSKYAGNAVKKGKVMLRVDIRNDMYVYTYKYYNVDAMYVNRMQGTYKVMNN